MSTYAILRRSGWENADELEEAARRSAAEGDRMIEQVSWIRSYVLDESDGSLGTLCIYDASTPEAVRKHAERAGLPVDEIVAVADLVVVRPDPASAVK
jgi:sporulation protein YlmC with PRC-barrel domain